MQRAILGYSIILMTVPACLTVIILSIGKEVGWLVVLGLTALGDSISGYIKAVSR